MNSIRKEIGLAANIVTTIAFLLFGKPWLADLSQPVWTGLMFVWLFGVMVWASFGVVRHADCLAAKLGEPYGTLILTLSVISIEVIMITAIMLTGKDDPTLGRDMMFSVLMIVLNGLVGVSLFVGGLRFREQAFNLQGANTFLTVLIPLSVLGLILPNYTQSTEAGTFSGPQMAFLIVATLALYGTFLGIQTMRHREYFRRPVADASGDGGDHGNLIIRSVPFHGILLMAYMVPIVLLSKNLAVIVEFEIGIVGAPTALGGLLVALLVLSPEGLAAIHAALGDNLQRSINICLGSALATIGLTVPAILAIGVVTGKTVVLGLDGVGTVLLVLTLMVSLVNFSSTRSNMMQGLVHLILFLSYLVMIFD